MSVSPVREADTFSVAALMLLGGQQHNPPSQGPTAPSGQNTARKHSCGLQAVCCMPGSVVPGPSSGEMALA